MNGGRKPGDEWPADAGPTRRRLALMDRMELLDGMAEKEAAWPTHE